MSVQKLKIAIMAGGTGGHIFPGIAIAEALKAQGVEVFWLGGMRGLERTILPKTEIEHQFMQVDSIRGKGLKGWLMLPVKLLKQVLVARNILKKHHVTASISMGGYVAGPGGLASQLVGIALYVHEQNSVPGLTNKVLARFARKVFTGFPDILSSKNSCYVGNPVRADLVGIEHQQSEAGAVKLLVLGGSQGAQKLNETLPEALRLIDKKYQPEVVHQCGAKHKEAAQYAYKSSGVTAKVVDFIDDMATAYAWADIVVCRSGALTVAELTVVGLPSILVPFPAAVDDHQTKNADFLVKNGAAVRLSEVQLSAEKLAQQISTLIRDKHKREKMAQQAKSVAKTKAAEQVAKMIMEDVAHAA